MRTLYNTEEIFRQDQVFFHKQAHKNYQKTVKELKKTEKSYAYFNIGFFLLFFIEIIGFAVLFADLSSSSILALILGSIFLTCFSYFVLLFYFQAKKTDQLTQIKDRFLLNCRRALSVPVATAEHHLTIAHAAIRFTDNLQEFEKNIYTPFKILNFLYPLIQSFSSFLHKEDIFKFKEQLLLAAIDEHVKQVKSTPTDLEVHASIASVYSKLSKLYLDAINQKIISKNQKNLLEQKYDISIKSMIEEYKILNDYAPNDPWVHMQLALSYKTLNMKKEEAKESEIILKLCPHDNNILFRLGVLYFEMNFPSKALRIYEDLKSKAYKNADDLLSYYGSFKLQNLFEETL